MNIEPINGAESSGKLRLLSLDALDQRTSAAKRAIRAQDALAAHAHGGGRESGVAVSMATRAIFLNLLLEDMEARMLKGEPVEQDRYLSLTNAHRRALESLGAPNSEPIPKTEESAEPIARAIVTILQDEGVDVAKLSFLGQEPAPDLLAPTQGEPEASSLSASDSPNFSPPFENEGPEIFANGASVQEVRMNGSGNIRWAVSDSCGHVHAYRRERAAAVELAKNLPTPSLDPVPEDEVCE